MEYLTCLRPSKKGQFLEMWAPPLCFAAAVASVLSGGLAMDIFLFYSILSPWTLQSCVHLFICVCVLIDREKG